MPWNSSAPTQTFGRTDGTRTGTDVWQNADAAGVDIVADDHDTHDQDVADGINACLKKDGGNTATSNLPMGGFRHTNVGAASVTTDYARYSDAVKAGYIPTVGGTANALVLTTGYTVTALAVGQQYSFLVGATNTGAVTAVIDGLTAVSLVRNDGSNTALAAGDLIANTMAVVEFDGTRLKLLTAAASSTSSDVLARIVKAGSIVAWPHATVPTGWLECNGATISRTTYAELFANIGTYYGIGDGSTTFKIPDYRGYFLRGHDNSAGNDPDAASRTDRGDTTTGDSVGTKQAGATTSHTHTASISVSGTTSSDGAHTHTYSGTSASGGVDHDHTYSGTSASGGVDHTHTFSGTSASGGVDHDHTFSGTSGGNIGGSHSHTFSGATGGENEAHTHTGTTASNGAHTHTFNRGNVNLTVAGLSAGSVLSGTLTSDTTGSDGAHTHTITTGAANGAHTHNYSGTTSTDSSTHTHAYSGTTSASSAYLHTHTYSGTTSAASAYAHTHTYSGTTSAASAYLHTHTYSGTTASNGAHTHTVTSTGSNTTDATGGNETRPKNVNVKWIILALPAAASASTLGVNGFQYAFDTGTSDADPGTGRLRFNNATLSSATALYINESDANSSSVASFLATLDDSTSTVRGMLHFYKIGAPGTYAVFSISGAITDAGSYDKFTCAYVSGSGSFADGDNIAVLFYRAGDKGDTGATGGGVAYLWSSTTTDSDPGAGTIRANNATLASVTQFYIDLLDSTGADQTTFLDSLDDSTNIPTKGLLQLFKSSNTSVFATYQLTTITTASGYRKLNVTYVTGSGSLSAADAVSVVFVRTGDQGVNAGAAYAFSTTTTDSDPGAGTLRANNATLSSATQLYIDLLDSAGATQTTWIDSLDDSTDPSIKAIIQITKQAAPTTFATFQLTSITTASGYRKLNVTYLAGTGSLSNADAITIAVFRTGNAGNNAGALYTWDALSTTDSDPGNGTLKANNATLASVTTFYIDLLDNGGATQTTWLDALDDSTSTVKGYLTVSKNALSSAFALYTITSVTSATGYRKLVVSYVTGVGSFSTGDVLSVSFARTGDKGDTGTAGSNGSNGTNGSNGVSAGIRWNFESSTTMAAPASGGIRLNNGTLSSVTAAAINANCGETGNPSVLEFLQQWDDSSNTALRGTIIVKNASAPQNFAVYNLTGALTDSTSWVQLVLTYVKHGGSFSAADVLSVAFSRSGDKGATGSGSGDLLAANNLSDISNATSAFDNIKQSATTSYVGAAQLATSAEAGTGTNGTKAVTPAGLFVAEADISSASPCNIFAAGSTNVRITGTTSFSAFDASAAAGLYRRVRFQSALTITYNATSMILPGAKDVTTAAGDTCEVLSLGSGNYKVRNYMRQDGHPLVAQQATVTSASADLGSTNAWSVIISGTTTITSFGSTAPTGAVKFVEFSGVLTLTHNATSLILPTGRSIVTAAGDCLTARHGGSGNWRVTHFTRASALSDPFTAVAPYMHAAFGGL